MNRRFFALILSFLLWGVLCIATPLPVGAHERNDGGYYTVYDENKVIVLQTAWGIRVGDEFMTENNNRYTIVSVEGDSAVARLTQAGNAVSLIGSDWLQKVGTVLDPPLVRAQGTGKVAIYHTHSDECYTPSDGTDSKFGNGGIFQVGDSFASALEAQGMQVIHSKTVHDPHDDMAYERSRRTVTELLKQQPDAVFDVHRDATPPNVYATNVNGQDITKVQLVVGRYGPTSKQIEDYALQLKNASDQRYPGLVKGIFFAKGGDYNQDLHPRSMLVEVGSASNDKMQAERGIALFADIIPTVLTGTQKAGGNAGVGAPAAGPSGASKSIGWMIGILVAGAAAFLFLSTGSLREAGAKLKQFTSTEFANFFGPRRKSGEDDENKDDSQQ